MTSRATTLLLRLLKAAESSPGNVEARHLAVRRFVEQRGRCAVAGVPARTAALLPGLLEFVEAVKDAERGDPNAVLPDDRYEDEAQ